MNKKFLIQAVTERLAKVENLIKPLQEQLTPLQDERSELLSYLKEVGVKDEATVNIDHTKQTFKIGSSLWERAKTIMISENKPLTIAEIVSIIMLKQPNIEQKGLSKKVSNAITPKVGKIIKAIREDGSPIKYQLA